MQALPTRRDNIGPLTGFRFVAALMVFLSHYDIPGLGGAALRATKAGYAGVTLFFVLSGFVIAYNYLERFEAGAGAGLLREYFVARLARVYPLYLCFMLFGYLAQGLADPPWLHLFALQTWSGDLGVAFAVNSPAWSIGVEMFLYLAFPLLVPAIVYSGILASLRRLQVATFLMVAAMACGAIFFTVGSHADLPIADPGSAHRWLYRNPATRLGDFLLGIFGAVYFMRFAKAEPASIRRWGTVTSLAAVLMLLLLASRKNFLSAFSWDLAYALPAILLIVGLAINRRTVISRVLGSPALVLLGEASYAFYLVHVPVAPLHHGTVRGLPFELALYVIFLGLVIALSIGLHIAIEKPARRWIRGWLAPRREPAALEPPEPIASRGHRAPERARQSTQSDPRQEVEQTRILPDGRLQDEGDFGVPVPQRLDEGGQILPRVTPDAEEHRDDGDVAGPGCDQLRGGRREVRRFQFQKSAAHQPPGFGDPDALRHGIHGLAPERIARAVTEQDDGAVRSHR